MSRSLPRLAPVLGLVAALSLSRAAAAAPDDAEARAHDLFRQGREAVVAGECAKAIPLLRRSHATVPSRGALFNLAQCEEQVGRLTDAWHHWRELLADLPAADERSPIATQRAAALEPRLARLRVELSPGTAPVKVTLDDVALDPARLDADQIVDPGDHALAVTWPGAAATREVRITLAEGASERIRLEPPREQPAGATSPAAPPYIGAAPPGAPAGVSPPAEGPNVRLRIGLAIGGLGLGSLAVGGVMGVLAKSRRDQLRELCPEPARCTAEGVDLAAEGATFADVSTWTLVGGLAALGAGTVLVLTSSGGSTSVAIAPAALPGGGGAVLRTRF